MDLLVHPCPSPKIILNEPVLMIPDLSQWNSSYLHVYSGPLQQCMDGLKEIFSVDLEVQISK